MHNHPDIAGRHPSTSLHAESENETDVVGGLEKFVEAFSHRRNEWMFSGFEAIRKSWLSHAYGIGQTAHIVLDSGNESGVFTGIDERGALRLRGVDGVERVFSAGDVTFEGTV